MTLVIENLKVSIWELRSSGLLRSK